MQALIFAVDALGFWYGGTLVEDGDMSFQQMLKVFFSIILATMGISQAQIAFPDVAKGQSAVARIFRGAPGLHAWCQERPMQASVPVQQSHRGDAARSASCSACPVCCREGSLLC